MTPGNGSTGMIDGVALVERATTFALGALHSVTPGSLSRRTPCSDWHLRSLLAHLDDSLAALHEAANTGYVDLAGADGLDDAAGDPVRALRIRATRLLGTWTTSAGLDVTSIGGCPVSTSIVTSAGALEIAVHGWDVAQATGDRRPIPGPLAVELLTVAPLVVSDADRPGRFAAAVAVNASAPAADRVLGFLGRHPS